MQYDLTISINTIVTLMILKWLRKRSFENRSSRPYKMQGCSWTTSKKRAAITPLRQVWRLTPTSSMALYRAILNLETTWMSKEKIRRIKKKSLTMRMQLSFTKLLRGRRSSWSQDLTEKNSMRRLFNGYITIENNCISRETMEFLASVEFLQRQVRGLRHPRKCLKCPIKFLETKTWTQERTKEKNSPWLIQKRKIRWTSKMTCDHRPPNALKVRRSQVPPERRRMRGSSERWWQSSKKNIQMFWLRSSTWLPFTSREIQAGRKQTVLTRSYSVTCTLQLPSKDEITNSKLSLAGTKSAQQEQKGWARRRRMRRTSRGSRTGIWPRRSN